MTFPEHSQTQPTRENSTDGSSNIEKTKHL